MTTPFMQHVQALVAKRRAEKRRSFLKAVAECLPEWAQKKSHSQLGGRKRPRNKQSVKNMLWGKTAIVLALFFIPSCSFAQEPPPQTLIQIARTQLGQGEQYGNNKGPIVELYTRGEDVAWCASFVSWVRFRGGANEHYFRSARSYWNYYRSQRTQLPKAGDLIVFSRGIHSGHIGIVERVQGEAITTIEGNVGKYPAKVREFHYNLNHIKNLLGFVRLERAK